MSWPMTYPKLRIAWSVAWGVVAVLLCVLWVRSYWWVDSIRLFRTSNGDIVHLASIPGAHSIGVVNFGDPQSYMRAPTDRWNGLAVDGELDPRRHPAYWPLRIRDAYLDQVFVPYWISFLAAVAVASLPWWPTRFSLRTLLLATTLVAVVMAMLVYRLK